MEWISFTLLAATAWSCVNVIDKYTLSKLVKTPLLPLIALGVVGLVAAILIILTRGLIFLPARQLLLALLAGSFYLLFVAFYYQAIKIEEVSKIMSLFYLSPIFTLIGSSLLLAERPGLIQVVAIALLVAGAMAMSFKNLHSLNINKAAFFILLAAFSYALNQITTKYLLSYADFWTIFTYGRLGLFISLIPFIAINFKLIKTEIHRASNKSVLIIHFNQLLNLSGVFFITIALTKGYASLVNGLVSIEPALVFIISTGLSLFYPKLIKENIEGSELWRKSIAIGLILAGAVLIGF